MVEVKQQAAFYILPALSVIGFWTTVGLARSNGLFKSLLRGLNKPNMTLPKSRALLIKRWTYIPPVDNFLAFIITFFWPVVDGKNKAISLQAQNFVGQLAAVWIVMEAQGAQMAGPCSYLLLFGMAIQMVGAATTVPLWLALHLYTGQGSDTHKTQQLDAERRLASIPFAIGVGLLLPVVAMTTVRAPKAKQFWIIMFQIFPILTLSVSKLLAGRIGRPSQADAEARAYNMAVGISAVSHLTSFGPSVLSQILPGLFGQGQAKSINPFWTFVPRPGLQDKNDMVEATLNLLRWDETITATSFVIWALSQTVLKEQGLATLSNKFVLRFVVQMLALGPAGAAILLLKQAATV